MEETWLRDVYIRRSVHSVTNGAANRYALHGGFQLSIFLLDTHLARMLVTRPEGLRLRQSWSLAPEFKEASRVEGTAGEPLTARINGRLDRTVIKMTEIAGQEVRS